MLFAPADLTVVADTALLAEVEVMAAAAAAWPPGAAAPLARADWPTAAPPALVQAARVIDELVRRGGEGKLPHEIRERFLELYSAIEGRLPEASRFFDRHRADVRKMRTRSQMLRRVTEMRAERQAKALMRVGIDVHPDDLETLRKFAADLLAKRGIEPVSLKRSARRPGRPRKTPTESARTDVQPAIAETVSVALPAPTPAPTEAAVVRGSDVFSSLDPRPRKL